MVWNSKIQLIFTVLLSVSICSHGFASNTAPAQICEKHLLAASEVEGVPLGLLYAIALTETGKNGRLNPYALNIDGTPHLAESRPAAVAVFEDAVASNRKLVDLGCMQINYRYHHENFRSVDDMLDPKQNVLYAAKFLRSLRQRYGSWTEAVARYHAGPNNKVAQHRYVCRVLTHMIDGNFGSWTPEARSYCKGKPE
jgi:soluble lytic murein transglycosylase-like protein